MTKQELIKILDGKIELLKEDYAKNGILLNDFVIKGEIQAYTDVLCLIESSEILDCYKTKCPICNGKVEIHYNQNQIEVYECQNEKCGFEYPVRQDHIKRWKYGNGWWSKGL